MCVWERERERSVLGFKCSTRFANDLREHSTSTHKVVGVGGFASNSQNWLTWRGLEGRGGGRDLHISQMFKHTLLAIWGRSAPWLTKAKNFYDDYWIYCLKCNQSIILKKTINPSWAPANYTSEIAPSTSKIFILNVHPEHKLYYIM